MQSLGASFGTPLPASATCLAASSSCIRISASGQNRNAIPRRRARIHLSAAGAVAVSKEQSLHTFLPLPPQRQLCSVLRRPHTRSASRASSSRPPATRPSVSSSSPSASASASSSTSRRTGGLLYVGPPASSSSLRWSPCPCADQGGFCKIVGTF
ncbi:hypothetical protein GQ55_6G014100 [Panicum hallii var. hallii]|uniref:Uncharacterized protein n=1 Tax=Panicum hallii var. hallii TaxID=1504633 RepID=A0A2T7D2Q3_9POAL|nr:hypothetical protein GQ55_6G014100 [Panicum hallii var. hallii]